MKQDQRPNAGPYKRHQNQGKQKCFILLEDNQGVD